MIKPRLDTVVTENRADSVYAAVIIAAKRARQINSYYQSLGEGAFEEHVPPMVDTTSKNYLKIALDEITADKLRYSYGGR